LQSLFLPRPFHPLLHPRQLLSSPLSHCVYILPLTSSGLETLRLFLYMCLLPMQITSFCHILLGWSNRGEWVGRSL
jgi:hypothetical protein